MWLRSPDGGKNDEKTATQHMKQVHKLLTVIDPELNLSSLFDFRLLRDKFITICRGKLLPEDYQVLYNERQAFFYLCNFGRGTGDYG